MSHRNARLTVHGRRLLVERVCSGRPVAHVAAEMGISRATAHKWVRRWRVEGDAGLHDRTSRPHTVPHRTPAAMERTRPRARRRRPHRRRVGALPGSRPGAVGPVARRAPGGVRYLVRVRHP
ncbi:leucine zipper domain-containing protein [Streptomyces sp. PA03-5A]|nr:leucine zipper domain-containing protein [Streptomyces sp. PA03-5A]